MSSKLISNYNAKYFDSIDSREKAYILGFIYADGSNKAGGKNVMKICLHQKDIEVLYYIKNRLGFIGDFYLGINNQDTPYVSLSICSKYMSDKLESLGVVRNKSFVLKFPTPNIVPIEFINSFMLGYFDGDGSITKGTSCKGQFSITGNADFCTSYANIICENLNIKFPFLYDRHPERNNNIRTIFFSGNRVLSKIYNFLYKDCPFCLLRKRISFENHINLSNIFYEDRQIRILNNNYMCLTDLLVISGNELKYTPVKWKLNKIGIKAIKLIKEFKNLKDENLFITFRGGNPSTYSHPLLAYMYAKSININLALWFKEELLREFITSKEEIDYIDKFYLI